ncbi:Fic/DOC family protein [Williamsia muralis]|uniref:protein adenylyltransferase n=1 Tax=Williamsia marianensis TaxID=85044 RepID=A0ABU4F0S9_WILMA|nr:Fic family protein [Williamsia muralis]MDV7137104.1 Fic family protein [Williamsia muralis]
MTSDDEAGQVLENLPGFTDPAELAVYERRMAYGRVAQLDADPTLATGDFDFAHLQRIHRYILQDVYPSWAGEIRSENTGAMGMIHCRPEHLPGQMRIVFAAIDRDRPSGTDSDAAAATVANHWGEATALHIFRDGNSRTQRVFFDQYLRDAGWDIDWLAVNGSAIHAARHVAMATADSSFLAAELRKGIVRAGTGPAGSLAVTQGARNTGASVRLFEAMMAHKRSGGSAATFTLSDAEHPVRPAPLDERVIESARRAAQFARRDHPTARRDITSSQSAGEERRPPGRFPGPRPGRDTDDYGR